jgi:hypothetical protein
MGIVTVGIRAVAQEWRRRGRTGRRMGQVEVNYQPGEVDLTFTRTEAWLEQHRKV